MKVFGRQGDNYIVSINRNELFQIVFGQSYPDTSSHKVKEFWNAIDKGEVEVDASKIFKRMMDLHSMDLNEFHHGLIAKIEALKGLLTPIDDYIKERKPDIYL